MDYHSLIKKLATDVELTQKETREMLALTYRRLLKHLDEKESISLPGIGTFRAKTRRERKSFSPFHKRFMLLPKKRIVSFSAGKALQENVNPKEG
jgi:DNA-binding protein HU-beta